MHIVAHPFRAAAVEKAYLAVRIPAGMQDPPAQVLRKPRNRVGVESRAILFDLPDFAFQRFAESFVGIQRENPVVLALFGGVVFLPGVSAPGGIEDTRSELGG